MTRFVDARSDSRAVALKLGLAGGRAQAREAPLARRPTGFPLLLRNTVMSSLKMFALERPSRGSAGKFRLRMPRFCELLDRPGSWLRFTCATPADCSSGCGGNFLNQLWRFCGSRGPAR